MINNDEAATRLERREHWSRALARGESTQAVFCTTHDLTLLAPRLDEKRERQVVRPRVDAVLGERKQHEEAIGANIGAAGGWNFAIPYGCLSISPAAGPVICNVVSVDAPCLSAALASSSATQLLLRRFRE